MILLINRDKSLNVKHLLRDVVCAPEVNQNCFCVNGAQCLLLTVDISEADVRERNLRSILQLLVKFEQTKSALGFFL